MTTGASGFDPGYLWSPLKRYGFGLEERQQNHLDYFTEAYKLILQVQVIFYLSTAVFNKVPKLSTSHVFTPWMLTKAEQPGGGGSVEAIYKYKQDQQHDPVDMRVENFKSNSGSNYLLEGIHCGRVGS